MVRYRIHNIRWKVAQVRLFESIAETQAASCNMYRLVSGLVDCDKLDTARGFVAAALPGWQPVLQQAIGSSPVHASPATSAYIFTTKFLHFAIRIRPKTHPGVETNLGIEMKYRHLAWAVCASLALALAACGGGASSTSATPVATQFSAATSSGAITAFGSVFVNGHEFSTTNATVIDDDSGTTASSTSGLEVGMVVDVKPAMASSTAHPESSELHVHPLARGYVDTADTTASTLTVMGQTVQLTSATNFSDHRACVSAAVNPCVAITGQSGLSATTGSGASAVAGSYAVVHGYLFGSSPGTANIVATLVSLADAPTSTSTGVNFKAEGVVTAIATSSLTIGGLNIDLAAATCRVSGATTPCASAFSVGQVVSVMAAVAPGLPATTFKADKARLGSKVAVDVSGAAVEIEGSVSGVTLSPASFVVRGISVDASTLPAGSSLPAVGDVVRVIGTVSANGQAVTATSVKVLHASAAARVGILGDASGVVPGTAANTFVLTVLGQQVMVTAETRLADRSVKGWDHHDPAINPFNISTFQTYLAASVSQHLMVRAEADASGNLTALSVTIVPASTVEAVAGVVDAMPTPVNSTVTGTPSKFSIHGIAVSVDPAAISWRHGSGVQSIAAGDEVLAIGTFVTDTLTVTATASRTNKVVDFGVPKHGDSDHDRF